MVRGYNGTGVICPRTNLIRTANNISLEEFNYIEAKTIKSRKALRKLFKTNKIPNFNSRILDDLPPINIGLAISGGGYRSMLTAGGVLSAFDIRTKGSHKYLGGLLQTTNYISGISGGSWLVMSNVINDFKPLIEVRDHEYTQISERLLPGIPDIDPGYKPKSPKQVVKKKPGLFKVILNFIMGNIDSEVPLSFDEIFKFYRLIHQEVQRKKDSGYFISFTDYWGVALSRRLFQTSNSFGEPHTFTSAFEELGSFQDYDQPFPIIISIQKESPTNRLYKDNNLSHIVEFNPIEFGSWDSDINGFFKLKYLGTKVANGVAIGNCKTGYDNIGFLVATSSSLFNNVFMFIYNYMVDIEEDTRSTIETILSYFGLGSNSTDSSLPRKNPDYAIYSPNPFYHYIEADPSVRDSKHLYLVDGGDDGENIPFHPFLQPLRNIDIILSYDSSSDLYNYPNGSSLIKTHNRYHNPTMSSPSAYFQLADGNSRSVFPHVPEPNVMATGKSIFLGCDIIYDYPIFNLSNTSDHSNNLPPLIVYTPNIGVSYPSNISTFKLSYEPQEIHAMFENGYNLATNSNSSFFATCMRCAIIKRQFDRIKLDQTVYDSNMDIPEFCQLCYKEYCYHKSNFSTAF